MLAVNSDMAGLDQALCESAAFYQPDEEQVAV